MSNIEQIHVDDPTLIVVQTMVDSSIDAFINRYENKKEGEEFFIKAGVKEGEVIEHMWISLSEYNYEERTFTGKISNEPVDIKNVRVDDIVSFKQEDVNDLMITSENSGTFEGGFLAAMQSGNQANPIKDKRTLLKRFGLRR